MRQLALISMCLLGLGTLQLGPGESCAVVVSSLEYPQLARFVRISGLVELKVRVRPDGSVEGTEIVRVETNDRRGAASSLLVQASKENVQKWRFAPANGGTPREVVIRYVYRLEEQSRGGSRTQIQFSLPLTVEVIGPLPPAIVD